MLTGDTANSVINLKSLLDIIFGSAFSLLYLCKFLKGKKPNADSVLEKSDTEIEIKSPLGSITISKRTWTLYNASQIRKALLGVLKPMEREGVDVVEFYANNTPPSKVTKDELPYFDYSSEPEEPLQTSKRETFVTVARMSFEEGNKWKFSEGENAWTATIEDQNFIKSLLESKISISAKDTFKVEVEQSQYKAEAGLKSSYKILKVLEHKKAHEQTLLKF